jgi:Fe2+ or Zn2+ uptake regulation protein
MPVITRKTKAETHRHSTEMLCVINEVNMNHKQSQQRTLLLEMLRSYYGHLSAEQAYQKMKEKDRRIGLATVYRNLNLLAEQNRINKIDHPTFGSMYDGREYPHYHLFCERCAGLFDIPDIYLEHIQKNVEEVMNARIHSHRMVFEGICKDCLNDVNESDTDSHLT